VNRPWMPLYVADYLADTAHLNAAQSGAYLHLIMHYWQKGGLPHDDAQLAAIARMSLSEWKRARSIIAAFFQDGWMHRRIDRELTEANDKYRRRSAAGKKGADAFVASLRKEGNALSNAPANAGCIARPTTITITTTDKRYDRRSARAWRLDADRRLEGACPGVLDRHRLCRSASRAA
jgi:uncharacterized protein YdaU (DUF1376 family)